MRRVRVIACGSEGSGDDAAGLLAVRAAARRLRGMAGVEVVEAGAALNAVHLFDGADAAIVVDAIRTAGAARAPGELVRVEVGPGGLPGEVRSSLSSHGFGLAEAIGLAAALGDLPRVVVLGIEVSERVAEQRLSTAIGDAVRAFADLIVTQAERLSRP